MILLEVIATSPEDCITIEESGGNRIELTSALGLGGLTPSLGLLTEARLATRLPLMVMIRPRAGGFCYGRGEFAVMQRDVDLALANGANGIVFGVLTEDGAADGPRIRQLVDQAKGKVTVFHRAIDVIPDPLRALDMLIEAGVTRVLTSGQASNALKGAERIAAFIEHAEGQIQIMPGAGISLQNVEEIIERTGVNQIHASLSATIDDHSTAANPVLSFGNVASPPAGRHRIADRAAIAGMRALLNEIAASAMD